MSTPVSRYVLHDSNGHAMPSPLLYPRYGLASGPASGNNDGAHREALCFTCGVEITTSVHIVRGSLPLCPGCSFEEYPKMANDVGVLGTSAGEFGAAAIAGCLSAGDCRLLQVLGSFFEPDAGSAGAVEGMKRLQERLDQNWLDACGQDRSRMLEICLGEWALGCAQRLGLSHQAVLDVLVDDPDVTLELIEESARNVGDPFTGLEVAVRETFGTSDTPTASRHSPDGDNSPTAASVAASPQSPRTKR